MATLCVSPFRRIPPRDMNFLFCFRHSPFYSPDLFKEIKAGLLNFLFCLTRKKKKEKKKKQPSL
jgi:hypothetical protein